jgi:hypothetical protein
VSAVFAFADESDMFVKTMPITRIYTHRLGYRVLYLKTDLNFGEFYVPMSWFDEAGGKGVLIKGTDPSYPYFSIFWKNGEFHSVKLYVKSDLNHESWGAMTVSPEVAARFDVDTLELDF